MECSSVSVPPFLKVDGDRNQRERDSGDSPEATNESAASGEKADLEGVSEDKSPLG